MPEGSSRKQGKGRIRHPKWVPGERLQVQETLNLWAAGSTPARPTIYEALQRPPWPEIRGRKEPHLPVSERLGTKMSHLATNYTIGQPFHEFQGVLCNFLAKNLVAVDKWEEYSNPSYSQQGEKQVFSTGIRKILEIFLDDRVGRGCVPSTVAWYRKEIGTFIEHITYNTYPDYGAAWSGFPARDSTHSGIHSPAIFSRREAI